MSTLTEFGRQNVLLFEMLPVQWTQYTPSPVESLCYYLHEDARAESRYAATVQTVQRKKSPVKSNPISQGLISDYTNEILLIS